MAIDNEGELKTFNADKYIAIERDLVLVVRLFKAFTQLRTGETPTKTVYEMSENEKVFNKVSGLIAVIHALNGLIILGWDRIKDPCLKKWEKDTSKDKLDFEEEDNDFNTLMFYRDFLSSCEKAITEAAITKKLDDDFYLKKTNQEGEEYFVLTDNYFEMRDDLEKTWPEIEHLLHKYAVLSKGFIKDEDISEKEKEEELKRRILNG